ncbi:TadE/TadG family type IV pilus assembly protein [Ensifer sp.]|uniref:TadE/TadG family type IV pilus assembly protein n=1 Tax=Ensifer sp. TaxID=1872086 RepID=UPI00289A1608|nr:TadE/TadG family type IV pilus assembly protein [Ensifer sp.]
MTIEQETPQPKQTSVCRDGIFRRLFRNREGAAAIEFTILAIPFMMVLFASIETFIAFTGEQLLMSATDTMARKIRTGEITFQVGKPGYKSNEQFRQAFCDEISVMMTCSATETTLPNKLYIDVRPVTDLAKFPDAVPRTTTSNSSDVSVADFKFAPGGPGTTNMMRAFYRWSVITDLVRPFITNLRPAGTSMPKDYLMVSTAIFRTESE